MRPVQLHLVLCLSMFPTLLNELPKLLSQLDPLAPDAVLGDVLGFDFEILNFLRLNYKCSTHCKNLFSLTHGVLGFWG